MRVRLEFMVNLVQLQSLNARFYSKVQLFEQIDLDFTI